MHKPTNIKYLKFVYVDVWISDKVNKALRWVQCYVVPVYWAQDLIKITVSIYWSVPDEIRWAVLGVVCMWAFQVWGWQIETEHVE